MSTCGLKKWPISKGILHRGKDDPREQTHRLLSGGNICCDVKTMPTFLQCYAADIDNNEQNYLVELQTPVYKLLVDLDIFELSECSYTMFREWIAEIQCVVADMYPNLDSFKRRVIVLDCLSKTQEKNKTFYVKYGFHLIWPEVYINHELGLKFRACVLQRLESKFGNRHADNTWGDVIDHRLYGSNGLRMMGSKKITHCNKKKCIGVACEKCGGEGKYPENRAYNLKEVMASNGDYLEDDTIELLEDTLKCVQLTSIRTYDKVVSEQAIPSWYDSFHFDQRSENLKKTKRKYYTGTAQLTNDDQKGFKEHDAKDRIDKDSVEYATIKRVINTKMPDVYTNIEIMDIHLCNQGSNDYYLVRTNSNFCMNKASEHNQNTIYFVVMESGICQKCFCRCDSLEKRKFGYCRDYRSTKVALSSKDKLLLFPNAKGPEARAKYIPADPHGEKQLMKELLQGKINEIQMWMDHYDGKYVFEKRFEKNTSNKRNIKN